MSKPLTAIVTGSTSGLGLELSKRLADNGYTVVGVARHKPKEGEWLGIEKAGRAHFVGGDVADAATADSAIAKATEIGQYKLLINCAGYGVFGPASSYGRREIDAVFAGNITGLILFSALSIERFAASGGTIVNVMSTASHVGRANETVYCAAKWGARGYTEALRVELKGKPVRIMAVYPGGMRTSFWTNAKGHQVNSEKFMEPAEVAEQIIGALLQKKSLQVTDLFLNRL